MSIVSSGVQRQDLLCNLLNAYDDRFHVLGDIRAESRAKFDFCVIPSHMPRECLPTWKHREKRTDGAFPLSYRRIVCIRFSRRCVYVRQRDLRTALYGSVTI